MRHSIIFLTASLKFVESSKAIFVLDLFFHALITNFVEYRILEKSFYFRERYMLKPIITNDRTIQQNKIHVKNPKYTFIYSLCFEIINVF